MGMSNVLRRCKIWLRAIRNASMTDQTVKAGTQHSRSSALLVHACSSSLNMRALYSAAFPVDIVTLGKVGRCICMQRLFYASFFNSEHVWHVCGSFHKSVQKWQSGPDAWHMFGKLWHIYQSAELSSVWAHISIDLPLMMSGRKPSWSFAHTFQNCKNCVLNAASLLLRGMYNTRCSSFIDHFELHNNPRIGQELL